MNKRINTEYTIEVFDVDSKKIKYKAIFHNLITDIAFNNNVDGGLNRTLKIAIGNGIGTPMYSDTRLFNEIYAVDANIIDTVVDFENGNFSKSLVVEIDESTLNGFTLTEVGIKSHWNLSSNKLCTHAMLDESVTKTDRDTIKITVRLTSTFDSCFGSSLGSVKFLNNYLNCITSFVSQSTTGSSLTGTGISNNLTLLQNDAYVVSTSDKNKHKTTGRFNSNTNSLNYSIVGITKIYNTNICLYPVCTEWFRGTDIIDELLLCDGVKKDFTLNFGLIESLELKKQDGTVIPKSDYAVELMKLKTIDKSLAYFLLPRESNTFVHNVSFLECKDSIAKELSLINIGEGVYQKYYNPSYKYGIDKLFIKGNARIEGYMESENKWYVIGTFSNVSEQAFIVPEKLRNCSVWKFTQLDTKGIRINPVAETYATTDQIHFVNPPADGEKIYADYKTKYIAKTDKNTYDFTVDYTLSQGEGSNPEINITELIVNPTSLEINQGETVTLEVSYKPSNAVNDITYLSDNPGVALVEQGSIRGINKGNCIVKVKSKNVYQDVLVTVNENSELKPVGIIEGMYRWFIGTVVNLTPNKATDVSNNAVECNWIRNATEGYFYNCLKFKANSVIELGNIGSFTSGITIEMYIKIIDSKESPFCGAVNGFGIGQNNSGTLRLINWGKDADTSYKVPVGTIISLALRVTGTKGELFANGILILTVNNLNSVNSNSYGVGGIINSGKGIFDMYSFRIYDKELTNEEITSNYNADKDFWDKKLFNEII